MQNDVKRENIYYFVEKFCEIYSFGRGLDYAGSFDIHRTSRSPTKVFLRLSLVVFLSCFFGTACIYREA